MIDYTQLDLGTAKPTCVPYLDIEVVIDAAEVIKGYAGAIVSEAERMNPLTFEKVGLTEQELADYAEYLLYQRVLSVRNDCRDWRKLKILWIPTFLQFAMSTIGVVEIRDRGLRLTLHMDKPSMSLEDAIVVSTKLSFFQEDIAMVRDAMPRGIEGDLDTMSSALVAGYIRSLAPVEHPIATYCAAFMGLKLREEQVFSILYRVQYDDINYLRTVLLQSIEVRGRNE